MMGAATWVRMLKESDSMEAAIEEPGSGQSINEGSLNHE
jgi:hypothetical protein